jgi:hypothetical protein
VRFNDRSTNAVKQAAEFGLTRQQKIVGLIFGINSIPALGLHLAQRHPIPQSILLGHKRGDACLLEKIR